MGFKTDTSFLRFLTMGARGVHRTMDELRALGFEPIELERYCGSNKIWATKVKRLRLPDLLCIKTGLRVEVRAKTDLKIRMSDAPSNPDRVWDAGNRDEDVIALIACFDKDEGPEPADRAVFFSVKALRDSVVHSRLGPPKSASEGAERDRTWPAIVPSCDGTVIDVTPDRLIVEMRTNGGSTTRRQTYSLRGKVPYVRRGDTFPAQTTILAGVPSALANLPSYLRKRYKPLNDLRARAAVDRYAAAKALRFRGDLRDAVVPALENLLRSETEHRVALEAAGSAAAVGSAYGQDWISSFIWNNASLPELRVEAALILAELGATPFTREVLNRVARDPAFDGQEIRQIAVWGLGKAGLRCYEDLLPFIDDADDDVALHAIAAFGADTPPPVLDQLVNDLLVGNARRAPAASEALRMISSNDALLALIAAANASQTVPDWVLATLGRLDPGDVRRQLRDSALLKRISPMLLISKGANWLTSDLLIADTAFLQKQDIR